jgi:hypothetical protein
MRLRRGGVGGGLRAVWGGAGVSVSALQAFMLPNDVFKRLRSAAQEGEAIVVRCQERRLRNAGVREILLPDLKRSLKREFAAPVELVDVKSATRDLATHEARHLYGGSGGKNRSKFAMSLCSTSKRSMKRKRSK